MAYTKIKKGVADVNYELCDALFNKYLNDSSVSLNEKMRHITPVLTKRVPQNIKADVNSNVGGEIVFKWKD
jgi:hypothetical protein